MMISGPLLFRADANVAMGTGHVMRCLALAQAWQDSGGRAIFAMSGTTSAVTERLQSESCEVRAVSATPGSQEDSRQTIALARELHAEWVVVDGYQFSGDYQRALKAAGCKVLFVDDYGHAGHYSADLVLNQNVGADDGLYKDRGSYTRLLLGTRYCLLRREFNSWRAWKREIPAVGRKVLIAMGGSDPDNFTQVAMRALRLVDIHGLDTQGLETTVVVGGSNPHWASLQKSASEFAGSLQLRRDVADMAELIAGADVAVSAAGTVCWEMCLLGLPALLIHVAENQRAVAEGLDKQGCAIHLGNLQHVSAEKVASQLQRLLNSLETRRSLSLHARELVDGEGAKRIASALSREESSLSPPSRTE
ncbi:MAG: UDP-2,4-diacetamido-2,4,6-trideoxy-beta-L-altropyranose hydrolase [Candidatus Sulfotelmatobacter sp.]